MTTSIARQSVIIKCTMQKSVLLGNYELYYVGGLMKKLFGIAASEDMEPKQLQVFLQEAGSSAAPKDERERYLIRLVDNYDPMPEYDEQMRELFRWGETEENLWLMQQ